LQIFWSDKSKKKRKERSKEMGSYCCSSKNDMYEPVNVFYEEPKKLEFRNFPIHLVQENRPLSAKQDLALNENQNIQVYVTTSNEYILRIYDFTK
jgi:hypothetical protein